MTMTPCLGRKRVQDSGPCKHCLARYHVIMTTAPLLTRPVLGVKEAPFYKFTITTPLAPFEQETKIKVHKEGRIVKAKKDVIINEYRVKRFRVCM
jgi:hypothetical protein